MTNEKQIVQFDYEYFVELSPDLICVAGYDGYFKKVNAAVATTLGYSIDELLAKPINTFVHPEDRELTSRKRKEIHKGKALMQFQNRYITKDGNVVRLFWSSIRIEKDQVVFAIAKNITSFREEEDDPIERMLEKLNANQIKRFEADIDLIKPAITNDKSNLKWLGITSVVDNKDQLWLNRFEQVVRRHIADIDISLAIISSDMAMSERQLFRQVKRIMDITPNQLVRIIRFHMAWEALASKQHHTLEEIAAIAGYSSKKHFRQTFNHTFGIDIMELL